MSLFGGLFNRKKQEQIERSTQEKMNEEQLESTDNGKQNTLKEADSIDEEEDPDMEYEIVEREILPAKILCPDCGGITLEGLDFCDKCGGELN